MVTIVEHYLASSTKNGNLKNLLSIIQASS